MHLLIPFAGRGSPACRARAARPAPAEARSAARAADAGARRHAATTARLSPPHERALAARARAGRRPTAASPGPRWQAQQAGRHRRRRRGAGACVTLCHWQVGIDDVALGDPAALAHRRRRIAAPCSPPRGPSSRKTASRCTPRRTPGRWLAQGQRLRRPGHRLARPRDRPPDLAVVAAVRRRAPAAPAAERDADAALHRSA